MGGAVEGGRGAGRVAAETAKSDGTSPRSGARQGGVAGVSEGGDGMTAAKAAARQAAHSRLAES